MKILFKSHLATLVMTLGLASSALANSQQSFNHSASPEEIAKALQHNQLYRQFAPFNLTQPEWQPVHDTEDFGYVLMSAYEAGMPEIRNLRKLMAQNLPADVKLVILAKKSEETKIKAQYSQWISPERLLVVSDSDPYNDNGFWARDSFPIPVTNKKTGVNSLVSAKYYRTFNSAGTIAEGVNGALTKQGFVFVGGNLLADEEGNCFSVKSYRLFDIQPSDFMSAFGCKTHHMLKHMSGIGDVDEVIKPLSGRRMLTNTVEYKQYLESQGYSIIMLPSLNGTNRTYINSLIVGNVVFMPTYGIAQDLEASKVFESLGYTVVGIKSNTLSDQMNGSIHCQTMAYPKMSEKVLLQALQGVQLTQVQ